MITFPKYERYHDSGVDWIGEVPNDWQVTRAKYVFREVDERSPDGTEELLSVSHLTGVTPRSEKTVNMFLAEDYSGAKLCRENDFVFNTMWAWMGALGCSPQTGIVSSSYGVYRLLDSVTVNPWYLDLLLRTSLYIAEYNRRSTGVNSSRLRLYPDKFLDMSILLPPKNTQDRIVAFLDAKTAEIDEAIAKKQRLIELLQEQKAILINRAVTQGLNPSAPLRDSGVPWIGQIPSHWAVKRVKHIFRLIVDPAPVNNDYELLSVYSDIGVKPRRELEERGNKASTTDGYWRVKKGDFIVNKLLAWMGAIGFSDYEGVTSPAYDVLRPQLPISGHYYHSLFRTTQCTSELKRHSRGIMDMRLRLYFDSFGVIFVPYPPLDEQSQIAEHLRILETQYLEPELVILNEIKLLQELKSVLIAEAVTGKIKI